MSEPMVSRSWSGGSLISGQQHLMDVEKTGLNMKKKMEIEFQELQAQLAQVRASKGQSAVSKKAARAPSAKVPEPLKDEASALPGSATPSPSEDETPKCESELVRNRKLVLLAEIAELEKLELRKQELLMGKPVRAVATPSPRVPAPSPATSTSSTPQPEPTPPAESHSDEEAGKEKVTLDDKGRVLINGKVASDSAIEQRLRRYCSKRKNGTLKCAQDVYDRFHNKGAEARTELLQMWKDSCLNKEELSKRVSKKISEETGKTLKIQCGWYTERQMRDMLKMPKFEIDSVVLYTSTRPKLRRKWKYNTKMEQHYVEVDETGELNKTYKQTKEEEETSYSDQPVQFQDMSLDEPPTLDDPKAETVGKGQQQGTVPPMAEREVQEPIVLLTKSMEALLAKSAKLQSLASTLNGEEDGSLASTLKSVYGQMDDHYDTLAKTLARLKNVKEPSETLQQNINAQLEYAEVLGSKATRAEVHAQPALKRERAKRKAEGTPDAESNGRPKPKAKGKAKNIPAAKAKK